MRPSPTVQSTSAGQPEPPNRIVHVPTDISSSHADGEVSERDIAHHAEVARGGTGFIIVGATTPGCQDRPAHGHLSRRRWRQLHPRLARLAEWMHRYGAKCAVQLQHPGRQCAIPRYNTLGANGQSPEAALEGGPRDHLRERRREGQGDPRGVDRRDPRARRPLQRGSMARQAGRLRRGRAARRAWLPAVRVHVALPEHAHGPLRRLVREPDALPARGHRLDPEKCGRAFPVLVRYSFEEWCPGGRTLDEGLETAAGLERAGVAAIDISQGMQESPGAGFDPMQYPQGWATYAAEATKKVVRDPGHHVASLRDPEYCEQILAEGKTDLVGLSRQLLADPYGRSRRSTAGSRRSASASSCLGGCWQELMMAKKEIACSINPACGNPAFAQIRARTSR